MLASPPLAPAEPLPLRPSSLIETEDRGGAALRLLMVVALYAIPLVVALRPVGAPVFDPDVWWHLRVGQWVVEHGTVPATDPLAHLDQPWVAYSWLYEVLLYGLYQWFGLAGVIVYRVALSLAVVAALHRLVAKREPRFLIATALTAAGVLAIAMLFSERPWLFTVLFAALTLDAVLDLRRGRGGAWLRALPLLYALWANIHIQFIYGLFILGLACGAPLLERLANRSSAFPLASPGWWRLVTLSVLCGLATLLTPYHVRLYGVIVEYATQSGAFRFVNELKALEFREPCDWVMLGLGGTAAFFLGRRPKLDVFELLLLVSAAFFAFRARRDLWFLVLAALAILSTTGAPASVEERFHLTWRRWSVVVALLLVVGAVTAWQRDLSAESLQRTVAEKFPAQAAAVVAQQGCEGPLYNDFNWGGYLTWALPHLPVAIDGRTNLHGDERIERFGAVWSGAPGWENDPDLSAAGVVIAPADAALTALLRRDGRFKLVHEDDLAVVFVARRALR